jgi:phosphoglycolate phosphatase-like HAD superfamily hydrolase
VTWGFRPRAELEAAGADAILDDPGQLAAAVG